jgi:hypothetical protein
MRSRWSRHLTAHTAVGVALAVLFSSPLATSGAPSDDAYVAGYVAAVLERQLNVSAPSLRVKDGVVTIDPADLPRANRAKVVMALTGLRGVTRVEIVQGVAPAQGPPTVERPAPAPAAEPPAIGFLPSGHLFQPLLADPRWPHVSAAYRYSMQFREENDWHTDLSLRAGLQFESVSVLTRNLQLLVELLQRAIVRRPVLPSPRRVRRRRPALQLLTTGTTIFAHPLRTSGRVSRIVTMRSR